MLVVNKFVMSAVYCNVSVLLVVLLFRATKKLICNLTWKAVINVAYKEARLRLCGPRRRNSRN